VAHRLENSGGYQARVIHRFWHNHAQRLPGLLLKIALKPWNRNTEQLAKCGENQNCTAEKQNHPDELKQEIECAPTSSIGWPPKQQSQ
ncbi:MAG: hypothetical protein RL545_958, partial [Actinomycetota bacterium]